MQTRMNAERMTAKLVPTLYMPIKPTEDCISFSFCQPQGWQAHENLRAWWRSCSHSIFKLIKKCFWRSWHSRRISWWKWKPGFSSSSRDLFYLYDHAVKNKPDNQRGKAWFSFSSSTSSKKQVGIFNFRTKFAFSTEILLFRTFISLY